MKVAGTIGAAIEGTARKLASAVISGTDAARVLSAPSPDARALNPDRPVPGPNRTAGKAAQADNSAMRVGTIGVNPRSLCRKSR